jgi:hypothetical protein
MLIRLADLQRISYFIFENAFSHRSCKILQFIHEHKILNEYFDQLEGIYWILSASPFIFLFKHVIAL